MTMTEVLISMLPLIGDSNDGCCCLCYFRPSFVCSCCVVGVGLTSCFQLSMKNYAKKCSITGGDENLCKIYESPKLLRNGAPTIRGNAGEGPKRLSPSRKKTLSESNLCRVSKQRDKDVTSRVDRN